MRLVLGQLVLLLAGTGLLRLVLRRHPLAAVGLVGTAGLALLAGPALLAVVTTTVAVLGGRVSLPVLVPLLAPAVVLALLPVRLPWEPARERARPGWATALDVALAAVVAVPAAALVAVQRVTPIASNDEYLLWGLRGRTLSLTGGLDEWVFTTSRYVSLDYPLLVPSLVNWTDRWAAARLDGPVHVQTGLLVVGMLLTVLWAGTRLAGRVPALLAALLVAATPGVVGRYGIFLFADVPLMCFAIGAAVVLLLWLAEPTHEVLGVAGVLMVGALSTKVEGQLFVLALGLGALVARPRHVRSLAVVGLAAVATTIPWRLWLRSEGLGNAFTKDGALSPSSIYSRRDYTGVLADAMWGKWQLLLGSTATVVMVAVVVLLLLRRGVVRRQAVLVLVGLAAVLGVLYLQYLVFPSNPASTPAQLTDRIVRHLGSSAERVLMFPVALLSLAPVLLLPQALRRTPAEQAPPAAPEAEPVEAAPEPVPA